MKIKKSTFVKIFNIQRFKILQKTRHNKLNRSITLIVINSITVKQNWSIEEVCELCYTFQQILNGKMNFLLKSQSQEYQCEQQL